MSHHASSHSSNAARQPDRVLVCGLGSLGQHCVMALREFGARVSAIERSPETEWEIPSLHEALEHLEIGDCQQTEVLKRAGIETCRAVLLVTHDERINLETALAARWLNPSVRLVVRSAKQSLNQLLIQQLSNFIAFEPTQLSASAFALAALDQTVIGFFNLGTSLLRVVQYSIQTGDRWCDIRQLYELNSRTRRILVHQPGGVFLSDTDRSSNPLNTFYQWDPDARIQAGDVLIAVESSHDMWAGAAIDANPPSDFRSSGFSLVQWWHRWKRFLILNLWDTTQSNQVQRVVFLCGITVFFLLILGTGLFRLFYPNMGVLEAFYATAVLLLGGYGDLFNDVHFSLPIPGWLRLFSLGLTLAGTAFIGVLYALLTEKLLTLRLQFLGRRPNIPKQHHVIIVGLGRVGHRVAQLLQALKQPLVGLTHDVGLDYNSTHLPIIFGNPLHTLTQANLVQAKSVIAVTEDELQNLELGLMAHTVNPKVGLVIRTYHYRFSHHVAQLFPYAHVLCASALSAEAFAAAAYGENVLSLFRLGDRTILVTEYHIEANDTLNGWLIADIAHGYQVVPLAHQRSTEASPTLMPSDDCRLQVGDRLVVLATIDSLKRIEWGDRSPRQWYLGVDRCKTPATLFEGALEIARISGCDIQLARNLMNQLPGVLPLALYKHPGLRLVRKLMQLQITARLIPSGETESAYPTPIMGSMPPTSQDPCSLE